MNKKNMVEPKKYIFVAHGGIGPIPGEPEARAQGCLCPGKVGDLDRWGLPGGRTIDNACPLHGTDARQASLIQSRLDWAKTEIRLSQIDGTIPPIEVLGLLNKIAAQVKPGDRSAVMKGIEDCGVMVNGNVVARRPHP